MSGDRKRIWVVTDGRAGNENPALGLAEAVAAGLRAQRESSNGAPAGTDTDALGAAIETKRIALRAPFALAPPIVWDAAGAAQSAWPFLGLVDRGASLAPPYPDLAIGAGRRSAPIIAALRRAAGGATRAVQIMNPQMPLDRFDLVVAPKHDRLSGANLLETVGAMHRVGPTRLAARDPRVDALTSPSVGLLLGGPSRSARLDAALVDGFVLGLDGLAESGVAIAATASRRTPIALTARIRQSLEPRGGWLWDARDGVDANPLYAMLGGLDAFIVTADSVNMTSEACVTGRPVYVAQLGRLSPKLERFHEELAFGGFARPLPSAPTSTIAMPSDWSPERLDDVKRAADAAIGLLG